MNVVGISGRRVLSANAQAESTTKAGLRNSDGWMLMPIRFIQRRAPFTSAPTTNVAHTSARLMKKTIIAVRRTCFGVRSDVAASTTRAGRR